MRREAQRAALGDGEAVRDGHDALLRAGEALELAEGEREEVRRGERGEALEEERDGRVGHDARLGVEGRELVGRVAAGEELPEARRVVLGVELRLGVSRAAQTEVSGSNSARRFWTKPTTAGKQREPLGDGTMSMPLRLYTATHRFLLPRSMPSVHAMAINLFLREQMLDGHARKVDALFGAIEALRRHPPGKLLVDDVLRRGKLHALLELGRPQAVVRLVHLLGGVPDVPFAARECAGADVGEIISIPVRGIRVTW